MEEQFSAIDLAINQFIGFNYCKINNNIISLVEKMELTKSEWKIIKRYKFSILSDNDIKEIDEYFKNLKK